jgi:hypothetical protein
VNIFMPIGSENRNDKSTPLFPLFLRAPKTAVFYSPVMAIPHRPDWFLVAWLNTLEMSQADLRRAAGWSKRKASELESGEQRYNRDTFRRLSC